MNRSVIAVVWFVAMASLIVGVDVAFLRHHPWMRLLANAGIVLVFAVLYLSFIGRPWSPRR
ncbi:MAG TPA: hypothetical protein VG248_06125 [Caulobacteraceae bacterium]|jgi:ABC-type glucose/galactose transport system permease subunit|nr:hypothetical protein [Caulobacteraceae bacterium]